MTRVDCTGNEEKLTQCSYVTGIGATNCYHAKDVGVMCTGNFMHKPYLIICIVLCVGDNPVYHNVNITAATNYPVFIGSRVALHCNVSPTPPVNTTYHWSSTVSTRLSSFTQYKNTDPNVILTIHAGHSSHGNYYCIVKYDGVTIGRGHTVIFVKGIELLWSYLFWLYICNFRIITIFK